MTMKKTLLAAALVLATGFGGAAIAQDRGGVRLLGVSVLDAPEGDRDVVPVACRPRVAAIKLRSVAGTAEVRRVALTYGNGERDVIRIRDVLPRGEETGWIDLAGRQRCVTSITVVGDAERGYRDDEYGYRGDGYRGRRDDYAYADGRYRDGRYRGDDVRYDRDWDDRRGRRPRAAIEIYGRYFYR
jgi:hypothetical protein